MPRAEFSLIERYFAAPSRQRADVAVGIGDDAAVLDVPPGMQLVAAVDTLVAGVHFPEAASASDIGHKALAVNLSDLAAMGARPAWALLALTLPRVDDAWLQDFAAGFFALAERFDVALVGGDTTQGPLTISVQLFGWLPKGQALQRSGARVGDRIYVSGTLGDAGLALRELLADRPCAAPLAARLHRPEPRVRLGEQLRGHVTACIDVSDGLLADLGHVLTASGVGARVWVDRLPRSADFCASVSATDPAWWALPLSVGDDYELCFTAPAAHDSALREQADAVQCPLTLIGEITAGAGAQCEHDDGRAYISSQSGYEHFRV